LPIFWKQTVSRRSLIMPVWIRSSVRAIRMRS
jgi:hypothetical protein